jgi:hypothetical protein
VWQGGYPRWKDGIRPAGVTAMAGRIAQPAPVFLQEYLHNLFFMYAAWILTRTYNFLKGQCHADCRQNGENGGSRLNFIRKMFEEGIRMREKFGADNVFDFSLGNPDVPPPPAVKETLHGPDQ